MQPTDPVVAAVEVAETPVVHNPEMGGHMVAVVVVLMVLQACLAPVATA